MIRIEYENKPSDLIIFNAIHQFLSPAVQGAYIIFVAFIFWVESNGSSVATAAATAFFWYLGAWAFQLIFNAIYFSSRKNKSILTTHRIEVLDDSLFEETKFNKSFFYWPGIAKAVPRPGFIAIYVTPDLALIVPNRAFSSSNQRARFLALVKERIHAEAKV